MVRGGTVLGVTVVRLRVVGREFGFHLRVVVLRGGCRSLRHPVRAGALRGFGSWNSRLWNALRLRSRVGPRQFGDWLRRLSWGRRWRVTLRRRVRPRLRTFVIGVRSMLVRIGRLSAAAADRGREGESQEEPCVLHAAADARRASALQLRTSPTIKHPSEPASTAIPVPIASRQQPPFVSVLSI
jgi:hypothetical protein